MQRCWHPESCHGWRLHLEHIARQVQRLPGLNDVEVPPTSTTAVIASKIGLTAEGNAVLIGFDADAKHSGRRHAQPNDILTFECRRL